MRAVTNKQILLSASVSCFNLYNIESQMPQIETAGIDFLHFDVVDGRFNNCIILGNPTLNAIRSHTDLPIEIHLGVFEPEKYVEQFISLGGDYIAVHYESMIEPLEVFGLIESLGAKPILALRAETDAHEDMLPLLERSEWVLKLTVNPGYSGQSLQIETIKKIKNLSRLIHANQLHTKIQADGNINPLTIPKVVFAGATILTGGTSGLFIQDKSIPDAALFMRLLAEEALKKA